MAQSLDPNAHKVKGFVTNLELRQASGTSDVTLYANFRTGVTYAMSAPTKSTAEERGDKRLAGESRKVEEGREAREGLKEGGGGGAEGISSRGAREVMERWLKEEEDGGDAQEGRGGSEGEGGAEGEREGTGRGGGSGNAEGGVGLRERDTEDHADLREADADAEDPAEQKLDAERRRERQRQRERERERETERGREEVGIGGASQHMREDMISDEQGTSHVLEGGSIEEGGGASGTGGANVEAEQTCSRSPPGA
jgi:hypothetical protein